MWHGLKFSTRNQTPPKPVDANLQKLEIYVIARAFEEYTSSTEDGRTTARKSQIEFWLLNVDMHHNQVLKMGNWVGLQTTTDPWKTKQTRFNKSKD